MARGRVTALGLLDGHYRVRGRLLGDQDRSVGTPEVEPLRVPVRWLRPVGGIDDRTHVAAQEN
ncbi:hypothetical protein ACQP1O_17355 [Nocardia sp. CA-151230]|uniref:hypothetical protein n=1 Tax=Nocardia sp. CA-151230 TaxID=3239982 RepID=UPI003D8B207D